VKLRVGYDIAYDFPKPTPLLLALNVHYSRASDVLIPDHVRTSPSVPIHGYRDVFGNWCQRLVAPAGNFGITASAVLNDAGQSDPVAYDAWEHPVEQLPEETLPFLLGSRYCETDRLTETAWRLFSGGASGWARVQRICDFVHRHIEFGYEYASATRSALEAYHDRRGVCRDFAHLAVTLCRCMNVPARYCTGYLSDVGQPPPYPPMDFAAWFEAYLGGRWYAFDPRNNAPRVGRVLIARGRDAADVALTTAFGPHGLARFEVWTEPLPQH
jgi:transglutaminase-like putative cysteine protease